MLIDASKYSKTLGSAFQASNLFDEINNNDDDEIILDYKDIQFISQSFAQKYVLERYRTNKIIKEINLNEENASMLNLVYEYLKSEGVVE